MATISKSNWQNSVDFSVKKVSGLDLVKALRAEVRAPDDILGEMNIRIQEGADSHTVAMSIPEWNQLLDWAEKGLPKS